MNGAFKGYTSPDMYRLTKNLYLIQFRVMKTLPALKIIEKGIKNKQIDRETKIIDTSSGTFALGLAMVCNFYNLKLIIVTDPSMDKRLKRRVEDLGAEIIVVDQPDESGNYQKKRLNIVKKIICGTGKFFYCNQYDNTSNADSYKEISDSILQTVPFNFTLVGSVGSGGSTSGIIKYLRKERPETQLVAVDTFGSVLFGLKENQRDLRGLGNSIMPKNLKHHYYDEVHWVSAKLAYQWTRTLHKTHGNFSGGTTGAVFGVGNYLSSRNPDRKYLLIGPDDGTRYIDTIYDDDWLSKKGYLMTGNEITSPQYIQKGAEAGLDIEWAYTDWGKTEV
ncbi:pyridoxal-phosphate dependent enzyme [Bacillus wiedmannii]|uniref:pyridoxal-phosphate dependent enzyme n=1 Tax=Bacillus wiedmannii TaxID=1890302 RepID=UPI00211D2889|nr:pyridoxal-phosphate dependent enzyme [Bacillus wiedmannii]